MNWKERIKDHGLTVLGESNVSLDLLHIRYIPAIFSPAYWNGSDPMALTTSPHVELMDIFVSKKFDKESIRESRYFKDRQYRFSVGIEKWTDEKIMDHIKHGRYSTYKNINKNGFNKELWKKEPIVVLDKPFWKTRYNSRVEWLSGKEIWNGAGRCSAALVLGYKELPCIIVEDRFPGIEKSNLDNKLEGVKK